MSSLKGYSRVQIGLHWAIAALIIFQLIFGESMGDVWRAFETTGDATLTTAAWAHILVGIAVLALLIWRIELRLMRGVPDEPATSSAMMVKASLIVHWVLYAVMFLAPITGLVAWYGGVAVVAEVHELLKPVLIVLIAGHFAAALWHQVWLKDNLMERMKRPAD